MNKHTYIFLRTLGIALALLCVLSACDMGYEKNQEKEFLVDALPPRIITHPETGIGVTVGEEVELSVVAILPQNVEGTLRYQWYEHLTYRAYQDQAGILIEGATSAVFHPPTDMDGEYSYYVVVTNYNGAVTGRQTASVKSDPSTITINDPQNARYPVITVQPVGANLAWSPLMTLPTLSFEASVGYDEEDNPYPSDELRYQWYVAKTPTNVQGIMIDGAIEATFIPPTVLPGQEAKEGWISGAGDYYYFVVITNYWSNAPGRQVSSVASNPTLISISVSADAATPVMTGQPQSAIYFTGETVNPLTVAVNEPEDGGTLSYQWYATSSRTANTKGDPVPGATSAEFSPPIDNGKTDTYYYYVVVINTNEYVTNTKKVSTTSSVAEVTIANPATGSGNATFTVQFGGPNQHQYVRGFGGMDVTWGNFPDYSIEDYENMFNPDILGYNMVRIMILPRNTDINQTLKELVSNQIYTTMDRSRFYENVKTVNRYGGYVLASPWSPPLEWKTNNSINGGGDLRESDYQNFANYLRAFAQNMLNNGAPVYAVSISNEPNYTAGYDGCEWTGDQMRNFFRQVGHFTEGVQGYGGGKSIPSVKTMNGESANDPGINASAIGTRASKVNIDLLGRHNYGSREKNGIQWIYSTSDTGPREMWMTEHNLNSNSGTSYPNDHTWNYIWVFMNDVDLTVRINHEAAFIWWSAKRFYSMIGDGTYGSQDHELLPRGWGLAHYAKFAKESYRVGVGYSGTTASGATLAEGVNINGSTTANFESTTVKVSAFMKLRNGEVYPVNWRDRNVDIGEIAEITMVMFTPTNYTGGDGYDMGTVRLQLPAGFRIASATAMRSDPQIFGNNNRGTPQWETVDITADRNAALVKLPVSTILSVRFTQ